MNTRDTLVEAGVNALIAQGYDGMSIGPLLRSVAVPKGSFYHFFESKEAFVSVVLDAYAERYRRLREAVCADPPHSPLTRLMSYFDALEQEMIATYPACGCLYGVLAQSMPSLGPDLAGKLRATFEGWERDLAEIIAGAQQSGEIDMSLDPHETARHLIDLYEGAVVRARATDAVSAFRGFRTFASRALGISTRHRAASTN